MDIWKANRADIAVDLIERYGFCVFPAEPDSKAPATSRGVKDGSNDKDVVRSWFTSIPDANIATATGEPSKIIVVDIDPQNDQDAFLNASELIGSVNCSGRVLDFRFAAGAYLLNSRDRISP